MKTVGSEQEKAQIYMSAYCSKTMEHHCMIISDDNRLRHKIPTKKRGSLLLIPGKIRSLVAYFTSVTLKSKR